jgi:thiol:disulfide interchange protein
MKPPSFGLMKLKMLFRKKALPSIKVTIQKKNPTIHTLVEKFKKAGVPLYYYTFPDKQEPVVFSGNYHQRNVLDKLNLLPDAVSADSSATPEFGTG